MCFDDLNDRKSRQASVDVIHEKQAGARSCKTSLPLLFFIYFNLIDCYSALGYTLLTFAMNSDADVLPMILASSLPSESRIRKVG